MFRAFRRRSLVVCSALVLAVCASALGAPKGGAPPTDIDLVSDEWHDLTRRDGSGLYFDLIRAVYQKNGVKVNVRILPYARGVIMVRDQKADAWVASFVNEKDFPLYPKWHFDRNAQMVVYRESPVTRFDDVSSLANKRVAWLRDFGLDRYIKVPMQITEVDTVGNAFQMLDRGRIDYFIGARSDLDDFIRKDRIDMSSYQMKLAMRQGLYLAFARNERGAALRDMWDKEMQSLHRQEAFRSLYMKYGYDIPFDR